MHDGGIVERCLLDVETVNSEVEWCTSPGMQKDWKGQEQRYEEMGLESVVIRTKSLDG
jgi:hypothetical protein